MLRQRVTTDIATKGGQFDIITIGSYETPIWGKQGWLAPLDDLGDDYDYDDMIPSVMNGLSYDGKLYAVPFYAESSFTFYRKDLFEAAGIKMPDKPTYDQIAEYAAKLTDKSKEQYGFCQRGKPGWGENMAFVGPMVNAFGGQWFDMEWKPQLTSEPWKAAVSYYVKNMNEYGPPGATTNGHNENRALFATGHCAMWVDATSAAGYIFNPEGEPGRRQDLVRAGADRGDQQRLGLVLGLGAGHPRPRPEGRRRQVVREVGDLEGIHHDSSASEVGWVSAPPGTRKSTYDNPEVPGGRAVREGGLRVGRQRRHHQADQGPGALYRHPVRGDPRVPGDRHHGRPAGRGGARRSGDRRRGAGDGAAVDRADDEAGRLPQVSSTASATAGASRPADASLQPRATEMASTHDRHTRSRRCGGRRRTATSTHAAGRTLGGRPVLVDDRPAGDDVVVLVPVLQSAGPRVGGFAGFDNYTYLLTDPSLWTAMANTLYLVFWVLLITVGLGTLLAVLFDQDFYGRGCPPVRDRAVLRHADGERADLEKHADAPGERPVRLLCQAAGLPADRLLRHLPLTSVIIIVAWQWLPFALLILLTAIQSLDSEQKEAARMDGAGPFSMFFFIILPHLGRAISVVIMIETIFLLSVFAEIYVTTSGGPGLASTNLAFLIYLNALREYDVGGASAGGMIAVVLANIVAVFLVRSIAKNIAD